MRPPPARAALVLAAGGPLLLGGCLAQTAIAVVTLPVKVTSKAIDLATTSQAEADQKRGRRVRQREEQLGRLQRDHEKLARKCQTGDGRACEQAQALASQIDPLAPPVPPERR